MRTLLKMFTLLFALAMIPAFVAGCEEDPYDDTEDVIDDTADDLEDAGDDFDDAVDDTLDDMDDDLDPDNP